MLLSNKIIFISALDWGLGHSTRCVPLIRQLEKHNKVIIGVTPLTRAVFEEEFPLLEKIEVPAYNIRYASFLPLWLKLVADWRRISEVIKAEQRQLEKIIQTHKVNVVISDNRFGMRSENAHCIFITHQLFLKAPFAAAMAQRINKKYILDFDEVWVPDLEAPAASLSGSLSHGSHYHNNVKYIGPQSRLHKTGSTVKKYDCLILISGPEPQSSMLKALLIKKALSYPNLRFALVSASAAAAQYKNIDCFVSPVSETLGGLISGSETVICRSGYSTLMDLHRLDKKNLVLIPTPGQSEQQYLAAYWQDKYGARMCGQRHIKNLQL